MQAGPPEPCSDVKTSPEEQRKDSEGLYNRPWDVRIGLLLAL